ncbi:hypothetical protein ITP53_55440, partial [Nonomuraea sp. K274]
MTDPSIGTGQDTPTDAAGVRPHVHDGLQPGGGADAGDGAGDGPGDLRGDGPGDLRGDGAGDLPGGGPGGRVG